MLKKWKRLTFKILQIAISVAALIFIVLKLLRFNDWNLFKATLTENTMLLIIILVTQALLSFINLLIEAFKWKQLTNNLERQSITSAFMQILKGIQFGMLTPARAGEPFGRVMNFSRENRINAILLSLTGSAMHSLIIAIGGFIGLLIITNNFKSQETIPLAINKALANYTFNAVFIIVGVALATLIILYIFRRWRFSSKLNSFISTIKLLKIVGFLKVLALTILRYLVFCFQLWLMLWFFDVTNSLSHIWHIALYFLIITIIPAMAIADLGIRGSVAIFIFSMLSPNSPSIIIAIFLLWCYNLAIPATIASLFNYSKSKK